MIRRLVFAGMSCAMLVVALLVVWGDSRRPATAVGPYRRVVPGLAADSAPVPSPTPTQTPAPGGGSTSGLVVTVIIRIVALELSTTPTGTTQVMIDADATVAMANAQAASAAGGNFTITDHAVDSAGCSWPRTDVSTGFSVIVYRVDEGSILMGLTSPTWHYTITCPPPAPPIRIPAFGEESLELFLRDLMTPYYAATNTVRLPLQKPAAPGCLKQYGAFSHSSFQADPAQVYVYVHEALCPLPPLVPIPQPTPTPVAYP